jgi:hypothetical protein
LHRSKTDRLLAGAGAFAAVELGAALTLGGFFAWGRAEALLFFAFRPWLLLAAAALIADWPWRRRLAFYLLALATAGLAESLYLTALGGRPWPEMLRGWAAGLALAVAIDLSIQVGRRLAGRVGRWIAAVLLMLALLLPGGQRPYETLALGPTGPRPVAERPPLVLMTGLPLVWGESGPFDPESRPAAFYSALQREFTIRPVDYLDSRALAGDRLLLLAQPRMLEPRELVALDAWVRGGGRALILADPELLWPSRLPVGDSRRPPPASLLSPLLSHWRLRLHTSAGRPILTEHLNDRGRTRRIVLAAPGRIEAAGPCRPGSRDWLAACRIGDGRALVVADADLLRDNLWTAPSPRGTARHARLADNPLVVAGWLDRLAGLERERAERPVQWHRAGANRGLALILAALPILGLFTAFRLRRR